MDKMQKAMAVYVKSISKRAEGADKEKQLPGGHLGSSMVTHGEDFEPDSEFGNCLSCTHNHISIYQWTVTDCSSSRSCKRASCSRAGNICTGRYIVLAGRS